MDTTSSGTAPVSVLTIPEIVQCHAASDPERIALVTNGRKSLTYAKLLEYIRRTTEFCRAARINRNDIVAVALPNGPEMALAFLGFSSAATCAPLNPAYRDAEVEFYLRDLAATAIVLLKGSDSTARAVAIRMGLAVIELDPQRDQAAGVFTLSMAAEISNGLPIMAPNCCEEQCVALVLHTSGTTSRPKMVPLTHANICTSAANIGRGLRLSTQDRCLNVMPLFHIHGLIGALLSSLVAGGSVACADGFDANVFLDLLEHHQPSWYTAVPTIHQAILASAAQTPEKVSRHCLRFVRSSSSSLPPTVMDELERTFMVPVVESYGMTEAAHQMASNPLPPAVRKPGSVGLPAGPEMAIIDEQGQLLPAGETGEIVIRGPSVTSGYAHNPEANQAAFVNGWLRTGDRGRTDQDGYFYITGRTKEMINRGGENISPREIDEVLLQHVAVAQAVTFAVPHNRLGEDVAAAVVLRDGGRATEQEIREFAMTRLAHFKVPSQVIFVTEIPKGPTGKLQRIGLHEKLRANLRSEFVAPGSVTEQVLAELWHEVLAIKPIGIHDNFFGLGGDSLIATQLTARINARFALELSAASVFCFPTVSGQAILIETELINQIEQLGN